MNIFEVNVAGYKNTVRNFCSQDFSIYKKCTIIAVDGDTKNNLKKMYEVLKNEQVNFLILTPTFVKMLLLDSIFNYNEIPNIKSMFFCGESVRNLHICKINMVFPQRLCYNT